MQTAACSKRQTANPLSAVSQANVLRFGVCQDLPKAHHHSQSHQHWLGWETAEKSGFAVSDGRLPFRTGNSPIKLKKRSQKP